MVLLSTPSRARASKPLARPPTWSAVSDASVVANWRASLSLVAREREFGKAASSPRRRFTIIL